MLVKNSLVTLVASLALVMGTASFANTYNDNKPKNKNNKSKTTAAQKIEKVDDATITKNIQDKLKDNEKTTSANIEVDSKKGLVTLKGDIKNHEVASEAVQIAESTPGVVEVDTNNLTIENKKQTQDHAFNDAMITSKVKGRFLREKIFGEKPIAIWTITVETKNGIVILAGTADTEAEITNAKKLAKSIKGVKNVESSVKTKS